MKMPKPSDEDKDRFRSFIPAAPNVEVKPMFGNLGAFVNGNMFAGLFGSSIGVKIVDETERMALRSEDGAGPFGPEERPMGGYVSLPSTWTARVAVPWVEKALEQVAALPPKKPKKKA